MARNFFRRIGGVSFAPGEVRPLDTPLPRNNLYRRLHFFFQGQVDTGAGSSANRDAPWNLIRRIEIIANGSDTIKNVDAMALAELNTYMYGSRAQHDAPAAPSTANQLFRGHLVVDFAMPRAIRPIDTLLDARRLSSLELRVTWGVASDYGTAINSVHDVTLDIYSEEVVGLEAGPFGTYKQVFIQQHLPTTTTEHQILLPVGNVYRGFMLRTSSDAALNNPTYGIVNNVILRSGQEVFFNWNAYQIAAWQTLLHGVTRYSDFFWGYYYFDLTSDGHLTEGLNTRGFSSLELVLDVVGGPNNNVRVYPQEIILPVVPVPVG